VFQEHVLNALVLLALRAKHRAFLDEHEWRLVSYHPTVEEYGARKRGFVPYARLSVANNFYPARTDIPPHINLEGIYVGPTQNAEASVAAIAQFLGHSRLREPREACARFRDSFPWLGGIRLYRKGNDRTHSLSGEARELLDDGLHAITPSEV
jgi:hypothetical protein